MNRNKPVVEVASDDGTPKEKQRAGSSVTASVAELAAASEAALQASQSSLLASEVAIDRIGGAGNGYGHGPGAAGQSAVRARAGTMGRHPRLSQGPVQDLRALQAEVARYDAELARRPAVVVATKMDLPGATAGLRALRGSTDLPVIPVCGRDGRNISSLAEAVRWVLEAKASKEE